MARRNRKRGGESLTSTTKPGFTSVMRGPLDKGATGITRFRQKEHYLDSMSLSPFVFACIDERSSAIAKYPMRAVTSNGDVVFGFKTGKPNRKHLLYRLLERPNPMQGNYEFRYTVNMHLDILGNLLVLLDDIDAKNGIPNSLWPLDPSRSRPYFDESGFTGYVYRDSNGDDNFLPRNRVIHFKRPSPHSIYWGMGIVVHLSRDVSLHAALGEYVAQFFNQGAQPSGILSTKEDLSPEAFERLRMESQMLLGGMQNAHRLPVLDNGLEFQQLSATLKDLGPEVLEEAAMRKILSAFKVPGTKFGLLEFSSYKAEDMEASFVDAMESVAEVQLDGYNRLSNMFTEGGEPVPEDEMEYVRNGKVFPGEPTGLWMELVTPAKMPVPTLIDSAAKLNKIATLHDEEKRRGTMNLLGSIVTVPEIPMDQLPPKPVSTPPAAPGNAGIEATSDSKSAPLDKA